ncbi:uncharacterized, partial [Tachysurus ichikawai]
MRRRREEQMQHRRRRCRRGNQTEIFDLQLRIVEVPPGEQGSPLPASSLSPGCSRQPQTSLCHPRRREDEVLLKLPAKNATLALSSPQAER